eukprot:724560-Karenia_brevis.AAC.1
MSSPRQLWQTYKAFTANPSARIRVDPDLQWQHWATQGLVHEGVWNTSCLEPAVNFVNLLRDMPMHGDALDAPSVEEVISAGKRLRGGRGLGIDGLPTDVLTKLPSAVLLVTSIFGIVFRYAVYPTRWGIGLIHSLIKPGKPPDDCNSLRGIRLLCRLASWLGQILDQRMRMQWQAGPEQFGFKVSTGCMEAVFVLLTL